MQVFPVLAAIAYCYFRLHGR